MPPVSLAGRLSGIGAQRVEAAPERFRLGEGYTPPHDPRLHKIGVTPDPGVIEVNTKPVTSWDELVQNTTAIFTKKRVLTRLGTEKFMLDGRHTGTGGGNHIVVGGPTPADSPLLRRPDLLRNPNRLLARSTRRCPISSAACSSVPPARPRVR